MAGGNRAPGAPVFSVTKKREQMWLLFIHKEEDSKRKVVDGKHYRLSF
jgi:hypothetical protein